MVRALCTRAFIFLTPCLRAGEKCSDLSGSRAYGSSSSQHEEGHALSSHRSEVATKSYVFAARFTSTPSAARGGFPVTTGVSDRGLVSDILNTVHTSPCPSPHLLSTVQLILTVVVCLCTLRLKAQGSMALQNRVIISPCRSQLVRVAQVHSQSAWWCSSSTGPAHE